MKTKNIFGGWAIDEECFNKIIEILPKNSTLVEFGSGNVTNEFIKHYNVISIEHDIKWVNKYNSKYIHAPLIQHKNLKYNWYDINKIVNELPDKIDLILIDGPPAGVQRPTARHGFYEYLDKFKLNDVILIFDDIHRIDDYNHMMMVVKKLNRKFEIFNSGSDKPKKFGIIYP